MGIFINSEQVREAKRCINDPFHFISRMKVVHLKKGKIQFELYDFQKDMIYDVLTNKYTITLKPRQMGITTILAALALWRASFRPNTKIVIVSLRHDVAKAFIRRMKGMYLSLPSHLQADIANGTNKRTSFGTQNHVIFENGSEIEAVASTEQAGRSDSINWLIMDEVAQQRLASQIWGSAQQTLADGGQATLISTAYGVGNFFHKYWVNAEQGLNGFHPIKLNWKQHPDRDQKWYQETLRLLGAKRTAQEVDCDFLQSGFTVFDTSKLRAIEERLDENAPVEEHEQGDLKVYHLPEPHKIYVLGADVATGQRSGDYSTFSIMDMDGVECACYKGKKGTNEFAKLIMEWGYRYNIAYLAPEINGVGEGVMALIQEYGYPNVYYQVKKLLKLGEFEKDTSLIAGWVTTGKSRHQIISGLDDDLDNDLVEINNPYFVAEAWTFIYNEENRPVAQGKGLKKGFELEDEDETNPYTDDAIFSVCIANEVRKNLKITGMAIVPSAGT